MSVQTITIQQNILKELGRNPSDTTMQERALHWLNKALDKIQAFIPDVEFLQTAEMSISFADGQATYLMPSDFFYLNQIRIDSESRILDQFSHEDFDRRHPYPADEDEDVPSDYTLEYDRTNGRHIIRVGPIPDATYDAHAIMRRWHPTLSASQGIHYEKLETALEDGGIWEGCLSIYPDPEYAQIRSEWKSRWLESVQGLQQVFNQQKPKPQQIRTVLRRGDL